MQIQRTHNLGRAAAIQRIDGFLDELIRRAMPAGVKLAEASKTWKDGLLTFSCKLAKGIMRTTIAGTIQVSETEVVLDVHLPMLVTAFVGEETIRREISQQMDTLFNQ